MIRHAYIVVSAALVSCQIYTLKSYLQLVKVLLGDLFVGSYPSALMSFLKGLIKVRPRVYKTFFMLSSVEHEILNAHKYDKYQEIRLF